MPALGIATGNLPAALEAFSASAGIQPAFELMAFNQNSWLELDSSTDWIANQGAAMMSRGVDCIWSVPFGGRGGMESVAAGDRDALYTRLFRAILGKYDPAGKGWIWVRPPWEMNASFNPENAAIDQNGRWNGKLYVQAFQRIVRLAKAVSGRFHIIWCPNVCTKDYDPALCYPGDGWVDVIAQDFYMIAPFDKPGAFSWFRDEARGLRWAADKAKAAGKLYAWTEWGMNDDGFVSDLKAAAAWLASLGALVHHHNWWNRADGGADCRLFRPTALGTAYQAAFAS